MEKQIKRKKAVLIEGVRRIGKSTIAEEFGNNNYRSYVLIDFSKASPSIKEGFNIFLNDLDSLFMMISLEYGVTLYNLIEGAKIIGFDAIGLSGKIENIDVNNLPCIAHLIVNKSYRHFVVIYQIEKKKKQVIIMDPAKGKKKISFSEFNLLSSSNYLFLKPIKKLAVMKKKNIIYKNISKLIKKKQN